MADDTLYIDADEEITSVIDKLKDSSAETVLLVVPKGATILQSVVNLKLLKKEADDHAKNIAFVTGDKVGRNLAAQVGITVYEDIENKEPVIAPPKPERPAVEDIIEVDMSDKGRVDSNVPVHHYQGAPGPMARERTSSAPSRMRQPSSSRKRKIILGLGLFLLSLVGLLFFFPRTTVVLGVKSEVYESSIELTLDKSTTEVNKNSSILPGVEIIVEKEKGTTATATGKKTVGETAKGTVTVYNCYQSVPLTLPKGRTLTSAGKEFSTTEDVTVPAATIVGTCTTAGQANVNVEAKAVGADSNLAANSTFCVAGYDCSGGTYVNAKNGTALQGGSSRDITFLQQEDVDAAGSTGKEELLREATNEVRSQAEERQLRVLEAAIDQQVLDKQSDKAVGTETNDAQVTTKVRVRTLAFKEEAYRQLIVDLLALRLPEGKRLILSRDDAISADVIEANWDGGFVKVRGEVKTKVADEVNEEQVKNLTQNTSRGSAEQKLRELPGVVEVKVDTTPKFLGRTSLFARNISVVTEAK